MTATVVEHARPVADLHDVIQVQGARQNNLRDISVEIPKRRLTVFTGVSGSGKTSLVFDTIAAESSRLINETYPAFLQGFMPDIPRPDVDLLAGLTPAIAVDQERMGANPRSTVGTVTDSNAILRVLFSRFGNPYLGPPTAFSFNIPTRRASGVMTTTKEGREVREVVKNQVYLGGMCPTCEGRGTVSELDLTAVFDEGKSLNDGAILVPGYTPDGWLVRQFAESGLYPADKPISSFTPKQRELFLYGEPRKISIQGINMTVEGLIPKIRKSILSKDPDSAQPATAKFLERAATFGICPTCHGTRLTPEVLQCKINGQSIADLCAMQITDLARWVADLELPEAGPLLTALRDNLAAFVRLGLGYLSLDRPSGTLSGGESQRIRLLRHLGSALTDVTYIFDEPSIGLHPHDIARLSDLLLELRDKGNTVLVVEHKPEVIAIADHVIDLGPGAGTRGGEVCFTGTVAELAKSQTKTGQHLHDRKHLKPETRSPQGAIHIRGANANNLRDVNVDIPLGVLTVVTGVAGSGKSSLIRGSLAPHDDVYVIDQGAIRGSRRSNPATYTGLLEPIRKAFAKANDVKPALFSANSEGACPTCKGAGVIVTELGYLESVSTPCDECGGRRFKPEVEAYHLGGKSIADVLELSIYDAYEFFAPDGPAPLPAAHKILGRLVSVGLGYVSLGQPLNTLSGGERQRLKLAVNLGAPGGVFVLDEPTTGLHLADVEQLLALLDRMVDEGRSVVVIEHHQAVMAHADHLIDLGPGAGHEGGTVVFEGTPAEIVATAGTDDETLTGRYLAKYVA
ncbi:MAG: excinuclease ABC subunit UvrA [Promicromonosporaceae bacterium]|nr:excinuclease ABC subunit UvrA [Promicromonosporaceae bacterium]